MDARSGSGAVEINVLQAQASEQVKDAQELLRRFMGVPGRHLLSFSANELKRFLI